MGKRRTSTHKLTPSDENNGGSLAGSTLEDYFHSKKFDPKRDGLGQVSKHLLVGSPANNAMAMETEDAEPSRSSESKDESGIEKVPRKDASTAESKAPSAEEERDAKLGPKAEHGGGDDNEAEDDGQLSQSNHDDYEDDYESETPSPDASVAGMTLSDYLKAKEAGNLEDDDGGGGGGAKHVSKKQEPAAPKKVVHPTGAAVHGAKKALPLALISGMSLDHYLGATSGHPNDDDPYDSGPDSKSPSSKRKKSKPKIKAKLPLTIAKAANAAAGTQQHHSPVSSHDEYATPFQKRQTKKQKAKLKQQLGNGATVSKSILLADSTSSSLQHGQPSSSSASLQTKSIPMNATSSKDKDKKKPPHQQQQQQQQHGYTHSQFSQPPLPKLVASSSSAHSLTHKEHHEAETNHSDDSEENEKLPPLAHY